MAIKNLNSPKSKKPLDCQLGIRTPLSKIPLLGDLFFYLYTINNIINKFLLAGDKFMPEMHLRQPTAYINLSQKTK